MLDSIYLSLLLYVYVHVYQDHSFTSIVIDDGQPCHSSFVRYARIVRDSGRQVQQVLLLSDSLLGD
jgi:hypothetical protein